MATQNNVLNISPEDALSNTQKARSDHDSHLTTAETVARVAQERNHFDQVEHDDALGTDHIHTRNSDTADQKGLFNNCALEPTMPADHSDSVEEEATKEETGQSALGRKPAISTILLLDWQKIRQEPVVWGTLLLFAVSLIILLTLMTFMPYADSAIA